MLRQSLRTFLTLVCLWVCCLALAARAADSYALADGTTLIGEPVVFDDTGVILRLPDDKHTSRMPWTKFSQAGLEQFADNPKIKPLVAPFITLPPQATSEGTDNIKLHPVTRLVEEPPPHEFLLAAMAGSSVGLALLLLIYAANIFAAYEVATCRARPLGMVIGLSAILPVVGPAIFYAMKTNMKSPEIVLGGAPAAEAAANPALSAAEAAAAAAGNPADANPSEAVMAAVAAAARTARARAATGTGEPSPDDELLRQIEISAAAAAPKEAPIDLSFKRGQYTFNRRFIETKFAGFMQPVRSEADQKLELAVKLGTGIQVVERITRVGASEAYFEILQDQKPQEIAVPFGDIQEITIKSKPA